ncbi:MAG: Ig-like domain-containing protein, partial [Acidimicrobiales bacterium]
MYTTNQIADFFASDDVDGDTFDPLGLVPTELATMAATISSPRTTEHLEDNDDGDHNNDGDLGRIRQNSYLRGFRAVAALYKLFTETVAQPITNVVINTVEELEDHDFLCAPFCIETSNADFYARVVINGLVSQNRGDAQTQDEIINPNWPFGNTTGMTGSIPIRIEIWDEDGAGIDPATFSGDDDQSDITPGPGRSLDLTVDLAKCLSGADGAISGGASGKCGVPITIQGDTDNDEVSRLTFTIRLTKPTPTIATQASPANLLGAPVRDTATLTGGASPTGDVTFRLFSDNTCTTEVFASTNGLTAQATSSGWFTPAAVGTYFWTAVYNGDASNNPATSPCNAPNESVTITAFEPPPFTEVITGDKLGPVVIDAGESVQVINSKVVGPVTVNPGGALTVVNSKVAKGIVANAPGFLSICGSQVSGPPPGQALGVSSAPVPIRIGDPANGCAGNQFAGTVNLNANLATTFGANAVSHSANINNGGPGNTVIKANTFFQTLGCAGNSPPPTNAGQANTGSKSGQCAAL